MRAAQPPNGSWVGALGERSLDQADADQSAAEADRKASVHDEAGSTADSIAGRDDQAASDRDQVAADIEEAAADLTPLRRHAYAAARAVRFVTSQGRKRSASIREHTARLRHATAVYRDRISQPRLHSAAIRRRLIADGETAESAIRWCDAWETEAERQGIGHERDYWSRGTQWIWAERAAGRQPGMQSDGPRAALTVLGGH